VEALAGQLYEMELRQECKYRIWGYCRAVWGIRGVPAELGLI